MQGGGQIDIHGGAEHDSDPLQGVTEASELVSTPGSCAGSSSVSPPQHDVKKALKGAFFDMRPLVQQYGDDKEPEKQPCETVPVDEGALKAKLKELKLAKAREKAEAKKQKLKAKAAAEAEKEKEGKKPRKEKTEEATFVIFAIPNPNQEKQKDEMRKNIKGFVAESHLGVRLLPRLRSLSSRVQDISSELHLYSGHEDGVRAYRFKCRRT